MNYSLCHKDTLSHGLYDFHTNEFDLVGYFDNDWSEYLDDRKSTSGFVFFMGSATFTWLSKKQYIVTLSTCEAEYVATSLCVCHSFLATQVTKGDEFFSRKSKLAP
jgi:hypothetical protein